MMHLIGELIRQSRGASAAEYALILSIVGAGLAVASFFLGASIGNSMNAEGAKIENCATSGC